MVNNELMKRDVAIEIIAEMINTCLLAMGYENDDKKRNEINEKRKLYTKQRDEIYSGNEETIKYVIDVYGEYLKQQRKK